jgi:hypothetical protein
MNKALFGVFLIGIVAAAQTPPDQLRQIELQKAIWIVDAHRDNGKRFVVRSDERLAAFLELERITHALAVSALLADDTH